MIAVHRRMFIYPLLSHGACIPGHLFDSTLYDDGDVEEHDLSEGGGERWEWLPAGR